MNDKVKVIILNASEYGECGLLKEVYGWGFSYTTQTYQLANKIREYLPPCASGEIISLNKVLDLKTPETEEKTAKALIERLEKADAIIAIAPSHFGSTSHLFDLIATKSFYLARKDYEGFKLQNKVGGAVAIGKRMHGGAVFTVDDVIHCWVRHQMFIVPCFPGVQLGIPSWSHGFNFQGKWLEAEQDIDSHRALRFYILNLVNFTRIIKAGFKDISSRDYRIIYNPFEGTKCTVENKGALECCLSEESIIDKGLGVGWKEKLSFKKGEKVSIVAVHAAEGKFRETSSLIVRYLAGMAEVGAQCYLIDISNGFISCNIFQVTLQEKGNIFMDRIKVRNLRKKLLSIEQIILYLDKKADGIIFSSDDYNSNNPHNNLETFFHTLRDKQRMGFTQLAGKPITACSYAKYRAEPEKINFNIWLDASECMMSIYSGTSGSQYGIMSMFKIKGKKLDVVDEFASATTRIHGPLFARAALVIKHGQKKCGKFKPLYDPYLYTRKS